MFGIAKEGISPRVPRWWALRAATAALALGIGHQAIAQEAVGLAVVGSDQMAFSRENMDPNVSPARDFYRYAAGGWLDRVKRPERHGSYGFFEIVADRVEEQMRQVLKQAAMDAKTASKGSPAQQVGTFYNAYMNVDARNAAGLAPIKPYLESASAIQDINGLVRFMAQMAEVGGPTLFLNVGPDVDFMDNTRNVMFIGGGALGLSNIMEDVFEEPDGSPRISGYRTFLIETLKVAGTPDAEAARIADLSIAIDRKLHAAKLPPVEANDPSVAYNQTTLPALQTQIPQLDLQLLLKTLDFPVPDRVILTEPRYLPVLSGLLAERSIKDIRDYARLRVILAFSSYLGTGFDKPLMILSQALVGVGVLPPMEERALDQIKAALGQPVSRLYVDNFFSGETRQKAAEMVGLIKGAFAERMPGRAWLSDQTRAAAIEKLDKLSYKIGSPEEWVDYSQVDVTDDLVATVAAISRFNTERQRKKFGQPAEHEYFNTPDTLPMVVNAGYNPLVNGFEVPAAIIQAPMFDAALDPALNFCRMGAVLGHEMTHGFDWTGKQFDQDGNMKNWWQPSDGEAFDALAQKLITQANQYEVLPGFMNGSGAQQVGENMADLGGITLARAALRTYLAKHPDEDVVIDGLTQDQRCFLAWTQIWAWKGKDELLRSQVARDAHPPNAYRAVAPLLHLDAFYEAFGIKEGDPMWLDPARRVEAW
ncbi:M13 family metallopeptidase [Aestuariivirga sp.]|uniref:M13 family metallopeptidase n=1 Tax=Aestuariivirga sp. TaxID=2650926 RepID=UPI003593A821